MKFAVLASGSSGNSIYIESKGQKFLVDAGITNKAIGQRLNELDIDKKEINSVFITHEHSDHIRGVDVLARQNPHINIFANNATWQAGYKYFYRVAEEQRRVFSNQQKFSLGDLSITPFAISHDAADPVGFEIDDGKHKLVIATDLGVVTQGVYEHLLNADAIILESNHDKEMLVKGPYPPFLKSRISSNRGHLSNDIAAKLLRKIVCRKTQVVVLAHLSEKNNTPSVAFDTCYSELWACGLKPQKDFSLSVAKQGEASNLIELE